MSKAFKNQIATIAALDGFTNMMIDIIKDDENRNPKRYPWDTPMKETLLKIKRQSRYAQLHCIGKLDQREFQTIYNAINETSKHFQVEGDTVYSIVSMIAFALIGIDDVLKTLKSVKRKLRNNNKIRSFNDLLTLGLELIHYFDPDMDKIEDYDKAALARKHWEILFDL